ncbi:uncharacterized protein N7459_000698 [Penicillium hispanicum]|uniref:uncharacterized protein n=1 Tax=Penicillium hispanicum TaxID=1080232 RepID=UPI002541AA2A|nr:uncharacterized protein N7459_000698 [Penicillium hispanicum]KAJ5594490.1 hypothetical protein N7459_000698 [Penicillium hispanicum]
MLSISLPSLRSLKFSWEKRVIDIPPVKVHEIEAAQEKPARWLKHLLKLNHANYAILYNDRKFHNHAPHLLTAAFLQGADADDLTRVYESECKLLDPWVDSPAEVTVEDWRDYLGCREYVLRLSILAAFHLDFFEDELVRFSYDWKQVVVEYLFSGNQPVFHSLSADLGHPLIHLAYAYETSSREVAMEALGLAATCYNGMHTYFDDSVSSSVEGLYHSTSPFDILNKVRLDKRLDGLFATPGDHNLERLYDSRKDLLREYWHAWQIESPVEQFRQSQELAAGLLVAAHDESNQHYDFFLAHVLTTSHAVRVLLPLIPAQFQISLVRQWWLMTLAIFISQLRPEIALDRIRNYDLRGRDWGWAANQAVKGRHSTDAHYVKVLRCLKEMASTWGDHDDFYLKAATKFADEFSGWGGFN